MCGGLLRCRLLRCRLLRCRLLRCRLFCYRLFRCRLLGGRLLGSRLLGGGLLGSRLLGSRLLGGRLLGGSLLGSGLLGSGLLGSGLLGGWRIRAHARRSRGFRIGVGSHPSGRDPFPTRCIGATLRARSGHAPLLYWSSLAGILRFLVGCHDPSLPITFSSPAEPSSSETGYRISISCCSCSGVRWPSSTSTWPSSGTCLPSFLSRSWIVNAS
ncbi:MAG TPA: hypothetical protein EYN40_00200 [Planctomycetes bacterium]|nr:hypothetical protein [Planctomycetota bacterium]